jgi:hypothetical protein
MVNLQSIIVVALYAAITAASPLLFEKRQGTTSLASATCGTATYTKAEVDAAVTEGCRLYAAGQQIGSSQYPHRFNNREGLVFTTSGPYQEFPIITSGVYSGSTYCKDLISHLANKPYSVISYPIKSIATLTR